MTRYNANNPHPCIGRRVRDVWGEVGTIVAWYPLDSGMTDTLVDFDGKGEVSVTMRTLRAVDDEHDHNPLPSRAAAQAAARHETIKSLRAIRAQHVADFHKPWPGAEHGKAILGRAIDAALEEVSR